MINILKIFLLSLIITPLYTVFLAAAEMTALSDNSAIDSSNGPFMLNRVEESCLENWDRQNIQVRRQYTNPCEKQWVRPIELEKSTRTFEEITGQKSFQLRGDYGSFSLNFGHRRDYLISKASLKLKYSFSPSLLPVQSHVKVYLNESVIGIIPIDPSQSNTPHFKNFEIDPLMISDYNQLRFELIGHYTMECENPGHSSIWFDINKQSTLSIEKRLVRYENDLAYFPEPFFDERDFGLVRIPFVFPSEIDRDMLHSAGVLSSWFGAKSMWRGAEFPVMINQLPKQHAIVFATNENRPKFLAEHPHVEQPTIEIVSHPNYRAVKLLLIMGKNQQQLKSAVEGLVLGQQILTGNAVEITQVLKPQTRKPYDAPNWIRTDRPMKFIELVDSHDDLQVRGYLPEAIKMNMRVPADLFTWRSRGIPIDLKYRYTPPTSIDDSRLNVSINNQFIQSFNLQESGRDGLKQRVRVPLLGDGLFGMGNEFFIPAFRLGANNQMQFNFSFAQHRAGACQTAPLYNVQASIDPDSEIDFSGFPHYAVMPNLGFFANAGYPFTRLADLSETAVVLAAELDTNVLNTYLNLMANMGASTGYPALNFMLSMEQKIEELKDRDIIVIGTIPKDIHVDEKKQLPSLIEASQRHLQKPLYPSKALVDEAGYEAEPSAEIDAKVSMYSNGDIASLVGFESPFSPERSVIAVLANRTSSLQMVTDSLRQADKLTQIYGSATIFKQNSIKSDRVGDSYYVGELPAYTWIWYHLSNYPLLLALIAIFAVIIVAIVLWRLLKALARKRLED
jgi:cellulose synthase operon protein B